MTDTGETTTGERRVALLFRIQEQLLGQDPEDVAWVCAILAGHCTGILSGKDPAALAHNLSEVETVLRTRASETFEKRQDAV